MTTWLMRKLLGALKQIRKIDHWIRSAVAEAQGRSFVDASEAQIALRSIVENQGQKKEDGDSSQEHAFLTRQAKEE